jgi:hypothetical protein
MGGKLDAEGEEERGSVTADAKKGKISVINWRK